MDENKARQCIQAAVKDHLAWLDALPSQKEAILKLTTTPAGKTTGTVQRLRPVLSLCAALILLAGLWLLGSFNRPTPLDVVAQPAAVPALDRVDLYGPGDQAETLPAWEEGEMVYQNAQGTVLFRDGIRLELQGTHLYIQALDDAFAYPLFDDRAATAYPSLLLSNDGGDGLADAVQSRLIEKHTPFPLLTLAWKPVRVYFNGAYRGVYHMREAPDAHTVCRYEQLPADQADRITLVQGKDPGFKQLCDSLLSDPAPLEEQIDADSFIAWLAAEIYLGNSDAGTCVVYKTPEGKWKCLLQALDYGLFKTDFNSVTSYLKETGMGAASIDNRLFLTLLEEDKYRALLWTRLGSLYRSLTPEAMQKELDLCTAWLRPEMQPDWEERLLRMRDGTIPRRPGYVYKYVKEFFRLSDEAMSFYFQ